MQSDIAVLEQLNIQIGAAESTGDRNWLGGVLAPQFAFRRANGAIVHRKDFLAAVAITAGRDTYVESIHLYGDRAVVTCIVTMKTASGDMKYHNLRLFVRHEEGWKLLGWANEPFMGKTVYEEALAALEGREPSLDKIQSLLTSLAALGAIDSVDNFGLTIGMHAAALGNLEAVKAAQKLSPLLERRNRHTNANLLHYAAQAVRGGAEIIEWAILEKNAPIELLSERILVQIEGREVGNGHTVAMEAVFNNNATAIEALLAIDASGRKVDLETPTLMGWTPRGMALRDGHEFAEKLPPVDDQPLDKARTAAREFATREEDVWVWKHPSDKAAIDLVTELRKYVLSQGVARPIAALAAALASGVVVNACYGRLGQPLLNLVVTDPSMSQLQLDQQARYAEVVGWLIERGANPRIKEMAPMAVGGGFREAVFGYRDALARMFESIRPGEECQAFIDERGPMNGYTRLNDAAFFGRTDVIELLLKGGADKSIKGFNGRTPYDAAVAYNVKGTGVKIPDQVLERLRT